MPDIGRRCIELRVVDSNLNWRIVVRVDADEIVVVDIFPKKTRSTPKELIRACRERLRAFDKIR
jgi:phage-related protein